MLRECNLSDISDGRLYGLNDMVKADAGGCVGCHKCCTNMAQSIVLDPYDVYMLKNRLGQNFQDLLNNGYIELNMVDGLILPNIKMNVKNECSFLNEEGRCSIHEERPGICRIFPLGRVYDGKGFSYFLQTGQCVRKNNAKIKVKKWIDTENINENQTFISKWHYFIKYVGEKNIFLRDSGRGELVNDIAMYVLNEFYVKTIEGQKEAVMDAVSNIKNTDGISEKIDNTVYNALMGMIDRAYGSLEAYG